MQAAVADLSEAEDLLQDEKRVLALDADLGFFAVPDPLLVRERVMTVCLALAKVPHLRRMAADRLALTRIGRVAPDCGFLAMQQIAEHLATMDVGCGGYRRVHLLQLAVDPNVRFQAEVPMIALLRMRISGSRLPSLFLVKLGALMMVASTIVPRLIFMTFSSR